MAEPEFMQMGKSFVGFYYPAFANDRGQLANVYTDQVVLFWIDQLKLVNNFEVLGEFSTFIVFIRLFTAFFE